MATYSKKIKHPRRFAGWLPRIPVIAGKPVIIIGVNNRKNTSTTDFNAKKTAPGGV